MFLFKITIFHLKYVQFCWGYKSLQNVNISFEICVNVFQRIQNVNISLEMCVNVLQLVQNVNISLEICVNVFQLIQNVNIPFEICVNGSVDNENCALAYGANVFYIKT